MAGKLLGHRNVRARIEQISDKRATHIVRREGLDYLPNRLISIHIRSVSQTVKMG